MSELPGRLSEFLDDLSLLEDRSEIFQMLIEYADKFHEVPARLAERPFPESHRVQRCESEAYVWTELENGGVKLHFAVENPQGISAKAMAVILDETMSGEPPEAFARVPTDIAYRIFGKELSMGKGQGLMGMVELAKVLAKRHLIEG